MNHRTHGLTHILVGMSLLVFFLVSGCGDDDPVVPEAPPELALALACNNGNIELKVRNSGGPMAGEDLFEAVFTDGRRDSLYLQIGARDSLSCRLSNIHGGATVTNEKRALTASVEDCLSTALGGLLTDYDIASLIPSPIGSQDVTICTYKAYLDNLIHDPPTFDLERAAATLTLNYVFRNVHADIRAVGSNWACPDVGGDLYIDSIVAKKVIHIDEGGDPEAYFGATEVTVHGLDVDLDGVLGWFMEFIIGFIEDDFILAMEGSIENEINNAVGSDLSGLLTVRSECLE